MFLHLPQYTHSVGPYLTPHHCENTTVICWKTESDTTVLPLPFLLLSECAVPVSPSCSHLDTGSAGTAPPVRPAVPLWKLCGDVWSSSAPDRASAPPCEHLPACMGLRASLVANRTDRLQRGHMVFRSVKSKPVCKRRWEWSYLHGWNQSDIRLHSGSSNSSTDRYDEQSLPGLQQDSPPCLLVHSLHMTACLHYCLDTCSVCSQ